MEVIVLMFSCCVINELGDRKRGKIKCKEGLNRRNKSFEKTIKLCADTSLALFLPHPALFLPYLAPHVADFNHNHARLYLSYIEGSVSHDCSSSDLGSWICVLSLSLP